MLLAHCGEDRLSHADLADEVGVHLARDFFVRQILDRSVEAVAGVVEQRVDSSEPRQARFDGRVDRGAVGDVALRDLDLLRIDAGEVRCITVRVAHRRDHQVTAGGQFLGGGETKAS